MKVGDITKDDFSVIVRTDEECWVSSVTFSVLAFSSQGSYLRKIGEQLPKNNKNRWYGGNGARFYKMYLPGGLRNNGMLIAYSGFSGFKADANAVMRMKIDNY